MEEEMVVAMGRKWGELEEGDGEGEECDWRTPVPLSHTTTLRDEVMVVVGVDWARIDCRQRRARYGRDRRQ